MEKESKTAIIGGSGSGKSTLLFFLSLLVFFNADKLKPAAECYTQERVCISLFKSLRFF
ncbi:hypothetical protein KDN24_00690 [Bacillus sp. Bva_UNVM-123]|uniref:hypothetical protein n=1 Tax=Bacillus sp. Bva_UNVM-123 TaxID=2829798 RepID=UPI00391F7CDD